MERATIWRLSFSPRSFWIPPRRSSRSKACSIRWVRRSRAKRQRSQSYSGDLTIRAKNHGAHGAPPAADERADALRDSGTEAGRTEAVERREMGMEFVNLKTACE